MQNKTVRMKIEPRPTRTRAGQVITRTDQQLIDLAMDSLQNNQDSGPPDLETDDDDQESVNVMCKMIALLNLWEESLFSRNFSKRMFLEKCHWKNVIWRSFFSKKSLFIFGEAPRKS